MSISASQVTRLGIAGQIWRPAGDFSGKAAAPPVFSGTIPDITGNLGDANIVTDLSGYFANATSYSIAPAVEAGWDFDTVTGILTVDTDEAGTFGTYVVTGTNASGSDDSNAFSVVISEASTAKGGYVPPIYVRSKRKRKDDSIRESIEQLLTEVKEAPVIIPQKVENQVREVYDKAPEVINIKSAVERTQKLAALSVEINEVRKTVKRLIKEDREDEEAAIQALLEIM